MPNKIPSELSSNEPFRPELNVDTIAAVPPRPGFIRKAVAYNNRHLGNQMNVKRHEEAGYKIVYSNSETIKDLRSFSPDNHKEASSVPSAVLKTTSDGVKYVLMEISEEDEKAYKEKDSKEFNKRYLQSVKGVERKSDGTLHVQGGFINGPSEEGQN